jgi:hypothetical protein
MEITSLELILKLLQDGKITVSEAMQLIQDLQNNGNITYVPNCPNTPCRPLTPYYQYYQVWCGDNAITASGNDGVACTDSSSVGFSSNYSSYAKC